MGRAMWRYQNGLCIMVSYLWEVPNSCLHLASTQWLSGPAMNSLISGCQQPLSAHGINNLYKMQLRLQFSCRMLSKRDANNASSVKANSLPSARQHPNYGDCLEVKREYYQNSSVLDCVTQCSQSAAHLREQFLQVQQTGFVTLGPLRCAYSRDALV